MSGTNPITAPGVYPLETRECVRCERIKAGLCLYPNCEKATQSGCIKCLAHDSSGNLSRTNALSNHKTCHGTGRVPDENGAKVRIAGFASSPDGPLDSFYWWPLRGTFGKDRSGPYPSPAEAYAAAQRAHEEGSEVKLDLDRLEELERKATPGPWYWILNRSSCRLSISSPRLNTVMDFVRWGMRQATARFSEDGLMHKAHERYAKDIPGQEHNSSFNQTIEHPDAEMMVASRSALPVLLRIAREALATWRAGRDGEIHFVDLGIALRDAGLIGDVDAE